MYALIWAWATETPRRVMIAAVKRILNVWWWKVGGEELLADLGGSSIQLVVYVPGPSANKIVNVTYLMTSISAMV